MGLSAFLRQHLNDPIDPSTFCLSNDSFVKRFPSQDLWYLHAILHKSVVSIQDNSVGLLLNGLLPELPAILDSFSTVPQVII